MHLCAWCASQNDDTSDERHTKVDDDVSTGEASEPGRWEAIDTSVDDHDGAIDTKCLSSCWSVCSVTDHGSPGEHHLSKTIGSSSDTSNLTSKVEPTSEPGSDGPVSFGHTETTGRIETASRGVGRDEFTNGGTKCHVHDGTKEPSPYDGDGTSCIGKRCVEGGSNGGNETHDTACKAECTEASEFSGKLRLVASLSCKLGVVIIETKVGVRNPSLGHTSALVAMVKVLFTCSVLG